MTTDLFLEIVPLLREGRIEATIYQYPQIQESVAIQAMYFYLSEGRALAQNIGVVPQLISRSNLDFYLHSPEYFVMLR